MCVFSITRLNHATNGGKKEEEEEKKKKKEKQLEPVRQIYQITVKKKNSSFPSHFSFVCCSAPFDSRSTASHIPFYFGLRGICVSFPCECVCCWIRISDSVQR